jgi:hypothetical protein
MTLRFFTTLLICLTTSIIAACASAQDSALPPSALDASTMAAVTPERLLADLQAVGALSDAGRQLASRLGIDERHILVRIQSRDCSVCRIDASAVEYPDLPLTDAVSLLQPNDKFWFVVQDLTCYYYYDGKSVSPLACGHEEAVE